MKLIERIQAVAELTTGRTLSGVAAGMLASQLEEYPEADVVTALDRCLREGLRALTLAAVTSRMPGAHLGAAEAWALAERAYDERASVVWTPEIAEAFGVVRHLRDRVAARIGFREAYERMVGGARERPRWNLSPGFDRGGRESAVREVVEAGRMTKGDSYRLLGPGRGRSKGGDGGLTKVGDIDLGGDS